MRSMIYESRIVRFLTTKVFSMKKVLVLILLSVILVSCGRKSREDSIDLEGYKLEIETWHQKRIKDLKADDGWLNIAGLFWLKEGINTFGSDEANDIVFPKDKIAAKAGFFIVKNGIVQLNTMSGVNILDRDIPVSEKIIFHPDSAKNSLLNHGSLQWFIIKRDDQVGIRLRDLESKSIQEFTGIQRYEVNPAWKVLAQLKIPESQRRISITNVLGQTTDQVSPGTLVFTFKDKEYTLDALDGGKDELFIIFGDPTNEKETYPAGRYLYIKTPDENGMTELDFNKAYNPPCAFTPFATCPLPPSQNVLSIPILAGEKNYHMNVH